MGSGFAFNRTICALCIDLCSGIAYNKDISRFALAVLACPPVLPALRGFLFLLVAAVLLYCVSFKQLAHCFFVAFL